MCCQVALARTIPSGAGRVSPVLPGACVVWGCPGASGCPDPEGYPHGKWKNASGVGLLILLCCPTLLLLAATVLVAAALSPHYRLAEAKQAVPVQVPYSCSLQSRIYIGKRLAASSANPL